MTGWLTQCLLTRQTLVSAAVSGFVSVGILWLGAPTKVDAQLSGCGTGTFSRCTSLLLSAGDGSSTTRVMLTAECAERLYSDVYVGMPKCHEPGSRLVFGRQVNQMVTNGVQASLSSGDSDGHGQLYLAEPESGASISLSFANGEPYLALFGPGGNLRWSAP